MTVFWLIATMLVLGVLLMVLPPLLSGKRAAEPVVDASTASLSVYRDQWAEADRDLMAGLLAPDQIDEARADIQRRVADEALPTASISSATPHAALHSRLVAGVSALLIVGGSATLYQALGDPRAAGHATAPAASAKANDQHAVTPEQIQNMAARLAERLKADPSNAEGWAMLARSYTALGRYRDAATAFQRANELVPGNASMLADHADVVAMAQGKRLAGEPSRLIQAALDADPRHAKALALAGSVSFEAHDYSAALGYWERLLAVVPPGSDLARSVQRNIDDARRMESAPMAARGNGVAPGTTAQGGSTSATAAAGPITGRVQVQPELLARIQPGDTLFVFARAAQGPRMPLAVVRQPVGSWPASFTLDDSMAMAANLRLSLHDRVNVGVRISRSGSATPQSGDLVGESPVIRTGARDLLVVVDRVSP